MTKSMIHANLSLGPHLFPESAVELLDKAYDIPGVTQLYGEMRDCHTVTAGHMAAVALLAAAGTAVCQEKYEWVDDALAVTIVAAALLHDIGKAHPNISPLIDVQGDYSEPQRKTMGLHTKYGAERARKFPRISEGGLIPDIIELHHADKWQTEEYLQDMGYEEVHARRVRAGVAIVSLADVIEATLPIGKGNSHASYGHRELPLEVIEELIYEPLLRRLPAVDLKYDAVEAMKAFARLRVADYQMATLTVA